MYIPSKMRDNIFDQDWFKRFNKNSMEGFMRISRRFARFGMTPNEIQDAIKSACDFFNIPMPMMIKDLTNVKNGQTMFVNHNPYAYEDDILCFNMQQLVDMKVDSKEAFSLVMTHECAHRVLQNTRFPGINNGVWEHELAADFLMGCRAGLWKMDDSKICVGLLLTNGSPTHPEGAIRVLFIRRGMYKAIEMRDNGIPLTIQNLLNEFMAFRHENLELIHHYQRKFIF